MGGNFVEDFYAISADLLWGIREQTPGEGPVAVGLCHGDYSTAEVKECLTANLLDPDDKIDQEHSRRLVRKSGIFPGLLSEETLALGQMIRTKLRFMIRDGKSLKFYGYNKSGAALTTGTIIEVIGTLYGRWVT